MPSLELFSGGGGDEDGEKCGFFWGDILWGGGKVVFLWRNFMTVKFTAIKIYV